MFTQLGVMKDEQDQFHVPPPPKTTKTSSFTAIYRKREVAARNLSPLSVLVWVAGGGDVAPFLSWPLFLAWVVCNLCLAEVYSEVHISYGCFALSSLWLGELRLH